jgi:uncharacterized membrane protein
MAHLVVVGFKRDMYRAAEVLNELKRLKDDWAVDLRDAVAVYRDYSGALRVDRDFQVTTAEGAAWGGWWGTVIGSLLAIPFTGGASGAVAAGTIAAGALGGGALGVAGGAVRADMLRDEYGISQDFVNEVSGMLRPGDSAIFILARSADPSAVEDHFRGWGGTILRTTLSQEQSERIERNLNAYSSSRG